MASVIGLAMDDCFVTFEIAVQFSVLAAVEDEAVAVIRPRIRFLFLGTIAGYTHEAIKPILSPTAVFSWAALFSTLQVLELLKISDQWADLLLRL